MALIGELDTTHYIPLDLILIMGTFALLREQTQAWVDRVQKQMRDRRRCWCVASHSPHRYAVIFWTS